MPNIVKENKIYYDRLAHAVGSNFTVMEDAN
jgi:hypothetical protein